MKSINEQILHSLYLISPHPPDLIPDSYIRVHAVHKIQGIQLPSINGSLFNSRKDANRYEEHSHLLKSIYRQVLHSLYLISLHSAPQTKGRAWSYMMRTKFTEIELPRPNHCIFNARKDANRYKKHFYLLKSIYRQVFHSLYLISLHPPDLIPHSCSGIHAVHKIQGIQLPSINGSLFNSRNHANRCEERFYPLKCINEQILYSLYLISPHSAAQTKGCGWSYMMRTKFTEIELPSTNGSLFNSRKDDNRYEERFYLLKCINEQVLHCLYLTSGHGGC